jgi:putative ABC transport system substrate-binding protein
VIPIAFNVAEDPVKLGLVASLARPGGNATGVHSFLYELVAKRLGLLRELVPTAQRVAALVNPANDAVISSMLDGTETAARGLRLQIRRYNACNGWEINAAFMELVHDRCEALFVLSGPVFQARRTQLAALALRHALAAAFGSRTYVEAGGLMSYGTNLTDMHRQVGVFSGRILSGAKPADMPVEQPTKFEFVLNLTTAGVIGLDIPAGVLAVADEAIE